MDINKGIKILKDELPEVFEGMDFPELEDEWIFIFDDDSDNHPIFQPEEEINTVGPPENSTIKLEDWYKYYGRKIKIPGQNDGKDGPTSNWDPNFLPPVDALGFYLPYHYWYPCWWGIYLMVDGINSLADYIFRNSKGLILKEDSVKAARLFIYYHEYYHYLIESFATKLEVVLHKPVFKTSFKKVKIERSDPDQCNDGFSNEEAMASAYSFRKTVDLFKDNKKKQEFIAASLSEYIENQPPCYREALDYLKQKDFVSGQYEMIDYFYFWTVGEDIHRGRRPSLWSIFPYALSGSARITSNTKYILHKNSPIAQRLTLNIDYFKYKEIMKKLRKATKCEFVRKKGSHETWKCKNGKTFQIPRHPGDLTKKTLNSILKQAGTNLRINDLSTI